MKDEASEAQNVLGSVTRPGLAWNPPTVRVMELGRTSSGGTTALAVENPPDYLPDGPAS